MLIRDTNIKIDRDLCTTCGICVDRCILDNLRLSIAPCRQACPLHLNCQGVLKLIARDKTQQALDTVGEFRPFLEILGLYCHAPCEKACARNKLDHAVRIRAMHGYLAKNLSKQIVDAQYPTQKTSGKKVAIMGSGPAAMMAAWRLKRRGHQIVVHAFEKNIEDAFRDYGTTSRIPPEPLSNLVDAISATGIDFKMLAESPNTFDELLDLFDATITTDNATSVEYDPRTLQALEQQKLFICAEQERGKSLLVQAFARGVTAAESVDRFLSAVPLMWERGFWHARGYVKDYSAPYELAKHTDPEHKEAEIEARFEAERCLGCGRPFDQNNTCWYCLPCEIDCPHNAIEVRIPYLLR